MDRRENAFGNSIGLDSVTLLRLAFSTAALPRSAVRPACEFGRRLAASRYGTERTRTETVLELAAGDGRATPEITVHGANALPAAVRDCAESQSQRGDAVLDSRRLR